VVAMTTREEIELFAEQVLETALALLIDSDPVASCRYLSQFLWRGGETRETPGAKPLQ
jgi:hypothetical protein